MPNNKRHTFKQIKNKNSVIHPYSRKAAQLQRISLRIDRLGKDKTRRISERVQPFVDRLLWFRYAFDDALSCATKAEVYDLIEMYIARNDDELSNLNSSKSEHKIKSSRHSYLEMLKSKEKREYTEGFEIPDLMNPKNVKILRQWDGDGNSMSRIKTVRIEDPNNLNNLEEQRKKKHKKFNSSKKNVFDNLKMELDQINNNNNEQSNNIDTNNDDEILNLNLLDEIKEKLIIE